ncbi:MAG: ABC transporter permease [Firmicutes bacterium]|nr:ABC transporter permease [Bacillota bacterium]
MGEATTPGVGGSPWTVVLRRLRRNQLAVVGAIIVVALVLTAVFAPWIAPYDPAEQNFDALLEPPSRDHWFGTDDLGRDVFSRVIYGTRYALLIGVAVVAIESILGALLGFASGYFGGKVDAYISRLIDIMLAIPTLVLALAIAGALGGGISNMILAIGVSGWTEFARLVRGEVLAIRNSTYIEAAKAVGLSDWRIILRHVAPNTVAPFIVYTTLYIPTAILWAASLSFLGLGAQPPTPEWGALIADGRGYLSFAWWIAVMPGVAIMVTVMGFNFLGDGFRDALDPKMARQT